MGEAEKGRLSSVPVLSIDYDHNFRGNIIISRNSIQMVSIRQFVKFFARPFPAFVRNLLRGQECWLSVCLPLAAAQDEEGGRSQIKMQL